MISRSLNETSQTRSTDHESHAMKSELARPSFHALAMIPIPARKHFTTMQLCRERLPAAPGLSRATKRPPLQEVPVLDCVLQEVPVLDCVSSHAMKSELARPSFHALAMIPIPARKPFTAMQLCRERLPAALGLSRATKRPPLQEVPVLDCVLANCGTLCSVR